MGLKAGWLALFFFVWIIGAFLGSTFEYQTSVNGEGISYSTGTADFTNGSATVTGHGTTWDNATMAGGNIKANADDIWCRVVSVSNPTTLTLAAVYNGAGGNNIAYTMAASPGWAGTGTGGYGTSPVTKFTYLLRVSNAFQRLPILGNVPLPVPNSEYFTTMYEVVTWKWSFMEGYDMVYWVFLAPFVVMGVLSMILLVYGIISGNLTLG